MNEAKQRLYPPRFKFEVSESETCSPGEYFSSRRYLTYKIVGGKVYDIEDVSDELSIPPSKCKNTFTINSLESTFKL